jgi:hypothetical protein
MTSASSVVTIDARGGGYAVEAADHTAVDNRGCVDNPSGQEAAAAVFVVPVLDDEELESDEVLLLSLEVLLLSEVVLEPEALLPVPDEDFDDSDRESVR